MAGISRLIRTSTLHGFAELADSVGLPTDPLLAQVGLSRALLRAPDYPLTVECVRQLLEASANASGIEAFGLRLGERRRLANLGMIGIVIREEATALQALHTLCHYLQLVNPSLFVHIDEQDEWVVVREDLDHAPGVPARQSIELALAVMNNILRELMGPDWRARSLHFGHRAPDAQADHRRVFGCPLHFNAEFNGIVCRRADLVRPRADLDPQLGRYVQAGLDKALAQDRSSPAAMVRQLILALLPQGRCGADEVAAQLGITSRTLNRRLAPEQASFSALRHQVRHDLVIQQLRDSDRPITHIAQLLGFDSTSAFAHWFQASFGVSARDWRRRSRLEPGAPAL